MCTSWVREGAREYSLSNHTGPPVLWSRIRLAHWPNYSQSKPIKSNYDQLWIIRMPRRLIARQDGAVGCHFQKTVTLIFFSLWSFTPSLSKSQCWIFQRNAFWLQKDVTISRESKNTNNAGLGLSAACPSPPSALLNYGGSHRKVKHCRTEMDGRRSVLCGDRCQSKMVFRAAFLRYMTTVIVSRLPRNNLLFRQLGILALWFASFK